MRSAKKPILFVLLFFLMAAGPSFARGLVPVTDGELDAVHARGLDFLFDANTLLSSGFASGAWNLSSSSNSLTTVKNSIVLSGGSQQTGLGIVNAVNSTVNMPINITVLINSQVTGVVSLSNLLSGMRR
jgi:hypothetical protein